MGKATKGTLTKKHLLHIFCFLSLIQVSLSDSTDSSKYSLFCFNSCKRRSIFKEKNETNKVLTFIIIIIIIVIIIIYLFSHDLRILRKLPKRRQLLAIFVKLNFSVYWYLFKPQNLPSATYLTDNPFFTDHTFIRLFSRMGTKPLHSMTIRFLGLIGRELLSMLTSCLWSIREQT